MSEEKPHFSSLHADTKRLQEELEQEREKYQTRKTFIGYLMSMPDSHGKRFLKLIYKLTRMAKYQPIRAV